MMIAMRTLLLVAAILTGKTVAQDPVPSPPVGSPSVPVQSAPADVPPVDVPYWVQRLGSNSYRDRLEAESKLREMGSTAKKALDAAAKDEHDREVQWRAKRLLRELEKARLKGGKLQGAKTVIEKASGLVDRPRLRGRGKGPTIERRVRSDRSGDLGAVEDLRDELERLLRRVETMHGLDVPRHRFFDDTIFKGLKSQVKPGSSGNSTSVQVGPGGVHVEVTETGKDGKPQTRIYDASDMETFHKKHPGVLQKTRGGLGLRSFDRNSAKDLLDEMRVKARAPQRGFEWQLLRPRVIPFDQGFRPSPAQSRRAQPSPKAVGAVPPTGRRLGIQTKPIPDALRAYLEMAEGTGLMVDSIQEDTLAAALRLRSGDIVTKINGSKIGSPNDVQMVLGAIKKGASVDVEFIRRGDRREATTEKQNDVQPVREFEQGLRKRVR
ncbi:MAG: hypothetical protein ACI89X_000854 [Planctomycetota bacterium]|jgi:hypothetical protein